MHVSAIHTYPVKGCYRLDHDEAAVEPWGLAGDRRFMITDDNGEMLTQREDAGMVRIKPAYDGDQLVLRAAGHPDLAVTLTPAETSALVEAVVWRTPVMSTPVPEADAWLRAVLGRGARLLWLDDPTRRAVEPGASTPEDRVSFADGYPLLLTTTASLDALNDWVYEDQGAEGPLPMSRFRPNVVIDGAKAWSEDEWIGGVIRIGDLTFRAAKTCARCVVTTTDQDTGERGRQPLRALARYRNIDQGLLFGINLIPDGINLIPDGGGRVALGDALTV